MATREIEVVHAYTRTSVTSISPCHSQQGEFWFILDIAAGCWAGATDDNAALQHGVVCATCEALTDCRSERLGSQKLTTPSVPRVASLRVSLQYLTSLTLVCTAI